MARIAGVDLPREKRVEIGLTYIYGIGLSTSKKILAATGINPDTRVKDLDENGVTFSGGELQKLMLARALYKDAPVVILDEPTAALDPIAESGMYERYDEMIQGRTSIFISHRLSSTRFCDRILFMEKGRIIEEGTHENLMEKGGAYAELFALQARYYQKKRQEEESYA